MTDELHKLSEETRSLQFDLLKRAFCALFCALFTPLLWTRWGPASLVTTFMFLSISAVLFWMGYHPQVVLTDRSTQQRQLYIQAFSCFVWVGATPVVLEILGTAAFVSSVAILIAATSVLLGLAYGSAGP